MHGGSVCARTMTTFFRIDKTSFSDSEEGIRDTARTDEREDGEEYSASALRRLEPALDDGESLLAPERTKSLERLSFSFKLIDIERPNFGRAAGTCRPLVALLPLIDPGVMGSEALRWGSLFVMIVEGRAVAIPDARDIVGLGEELVRGLGRG